MGYVLCREVRLELERASHRAFLRFSSHCPDQAPFRGYLIAEWTLVSSRRVRKGTLRKKQGLREGLGWVTILSKASSVHVATVLSFLICFRAIVRKGLS